jgi:asparagine synthase (glutamine-hydrolysing)
MSAVREDERRTYRALDRAFGSAIEPWRDAHSPVTLLFSGGVDSGLLAWELRTNPALELLTIGSTGAADLHAARASAARLGLRVRAEEVGPLEVRDARRRWAAPLEGVSPVQRSVLVAFALALSRAARGPVLCGQGADELFLGYAHFRGLDPNAAAARSAADLRALLEVDGPRVDRVAAELGQRLVSPFLAPGFVAAAQAIPVERRMPYGIPKALFRRWAVHRGLPAEVANRPKRAMQYGSGIARLLARDERPPPSAEAAAV